MPGERGRVHEFGDFRLDGAQGILERDGAALDVTPKELALLEALVAEPGRVVAKERLIAQVWPDAIVDEGNLSK